jgi:hypothetical protein
MESKNGLDKMITFKKSDNHLVSLGVGQVSLITKWLDEMGVTNYTINDDLTIDINGDVDLSHRDLDKFPSYVKFGRVGGYFDCSSNQLVSLNGSPIKVCGNFSCSNNKEKFREEDVKRVCKVKKDIYV